ncbi:C40 family peptidase [Sphaerisporangium album]|nr:C40 family peptidase [Sphaerisporangium album]
MDRSRPSHTPEIDPYGTPGARTWTFPIPMPGAQPSTDHDKEQPIHRVHQPARPAGPPQPSTVSERVKPSGSSKRAGTSALSKPPTGARLPHPLKRPGAAASRRSGKSPAGTIAVAAALRQLGTPYVWGGGSAAGATRGGFDCSGLALYAWSRAGVSLPHYTGSQFTRGTKIPISQLRPGDLVFFGGGTGDPSHVGIYLKNGVMIHAPKTGDVVRKVDFLHSPYYRSRYRGAIRPST